MSDTFWDGSDGSEYEGRESNAMKALREKAEADSKTIREMSEKLAKLEQAQAVQSLESVVKSKGLDPKVAALAAKAGVDPSEQAVEAFLKDYGDVFVKSGGSEPAGESEEEAASGSSVPEGEQQALSAMAAAGQGGAPPTGLSAMASKLDSFDNADDLIKFLESQS
jgi:hypothetical protein